MPKTRTWPTRETKFVKRSTSLTRGLFDHIAPNKDYKAIKFTIGDPAKYGNFDPSPVVAQAVRDALDKNKSNGYGEVEGSAAARESIAEYLESFFSYKPEVKNIILANGAAGAIENAITSLAERGDNILIPR